MKIVIFAPHPDDEIYGCGGSILKWMEEGNDVHIVYVTDNRAFLWYGRKDNAIIEEEAQEYINLTEDELGEIGLQEAKEVAKAFGFPDKNVHFYKFHDQGALERINEGIKLSKDIIKDANRIVLPSDNNNHVDHQATHTIVKETAKKLNLKDTEFYVYGIYNVLKTPREKQIKIRISKYQDKIYELMKGYKTQLCLKDSRLGWQTFKFKRAERFAIFRLEDAGKYYNF
ncbi:MAG: PIG-L deacetylase family protein [Promethearchaeota archaeon]